MRVLVVDDEPLARDRLRRLLGEIGGCELAGEAADGEAALRAVAAGGVDVVLLDIQMPGLDGLEVARRLDAAGRGPAVIFTTAHQQHALEAFDHGVTDYLLKPVRRERLEAALARSRSRPAAAGDDGAAPRSHICATAHGTLLRVPVDDVLYFQAEQKYVTVRHRGGTMLIEESLTALETEFGDRFVRLHRNALARCDALRSLLRDDNRTLAEFDGCEERLEVSRRHLAAVRARLREG